MKSVLCTNYGVVKLSRNQEIKEGYIELIEFSYKKHVFSNKY